MYVDFFQSIFIKTLENLNHNPERYSKKIEMNENILISNKNRWHEIYFVIIF
jgi:hypothetical protein